MNNISGSEQTYNGAIPMGGPLAISTLIKLEESEILVDLKQQYSTGQISGVQTLYIDLLNYLGDATVTMPDTGQRITARAGTQGYYPVLSTNLMKFTVSGTVDGEFPMQFINFPIALGVWPSGVKGEKGERGLTGDAGGLVVVEDADEYGGGFSLLDTESESDKILVKRITAGDGIDIIDWGDEIEIEATGGGGSGGGISESVTYMVSGGGFGFTPPAANALSVLDFTSAVQMNRKGLGLVVKSDGIVLPSSGLYAVSIAIPNCAQSAGEVFISLVHQSYTYAQSFPINDKAKGAQLTFTDYFQVVGMEALDKFKISVGSTDNERNLTIKVNVVKLT